METTLFQKLCIVTMFDLRYICIDEVAHQHLDLCVDLISIESSNPAPHTLQMIKALTQDVMRTYLLHTESTVSLSSKGTHADYARKKRTMNLL